LARTIPDPLARRHLLEGGLDAVRARGIADAYLEADREVEAIDFLTIAQARDVLASLQERAVERGDVFLMRAASRGLGEEPASDRWDALARSAETQGRGRDAETARRLATVDA